MSSFIDDINFYTEASPIQLIPRTWLYKNQDGIRDAISRCIPDIFYADEECWTDYDLVRNVFIIHTIIGRIEIGEEELNKPNKLKSVERLLNLRHAVLRVQQRTELGYPSNYPRLPFTVELSDDRLPVITAMSHYSCRIFKIKRSHQASPKTLLPYDLSTLLIDEGAFYRFDVNKAADLAHSIATSHVCLILSTYPELRFRKIRLL